MTNPLVRTRLEPLIIGGVVATCATLDAEALYSARSPTEYENLRADRRTAYEYLPTEDKHWQAAFAAQRELARSGGHRGVGIADLLTAVLAAELSDLDLTRELAYAHLKRHDTFITGSAHALANHTRRTTELELEYARRFADSVTEAEQKARDLAAMG